jgi:hypothetical protein
MAFAEGAVQIALALVVTVAPRPLAAGALLLVWCAADAWFHRATGWWVAALTVVHLFQFGLAKQAMARRLQRTHESQDWFVLNACVYLLVLGLWTNLSTGIAFPGIRAGLAFAPYSLAMIVGYLATLRMGARRAWLATLYGREDETYALVSFAEAGTPPGLMPLVPPGENAAREDAPLVVVMRGEPSPHYREAHRGFTAVALTGEQPPSKAPPISGGVVLPIGAVALPVLFATCSAGYDARNGWQQADLSATDEARISLGYIAKRAAQTYDPTSGFCASASTAVPAEKASIAGQRYASSRSEWRRDSPSDAGFACLGFDLEEPQRYQYVYAASPDRRSFEAVAHGDLNGDGVLSTFRVHGAAVDGGLEISPNIDEVNPEE